MSGGSNVTFDGTIRAGPGRRQGTLLEIHFNHLSDYDRQDTQRVERYHPGLQGQTSGMLTDACTTYRRDTLESPPPDGSIHLCKRHFQSTTRILFIATVLQVCWDESVVLVNSLPASELDGLSPAMFGAMVTQAKTEYEHRRSGISTSLCANLRAVDERLRMACESQYMISAAAVSVDEDISQMVNF